MSFCLCKVRLKVKDTGPTRLRINDTEPVRFTSDQYIKIRAGDYDAYAGPYEVTPRLYRQELETAQKLATENITINPIPNNYGLITWDGTAITVS